MNIITTIDETTTFRPVFWPTLIRAMIIMYLVGFLMIIVEGEAVELFMPMLGWITLTTPIIALIYHVFYYNLSISPHGIQAVPTKYRLKRKRDAYIPWNKISEVKKYNNAMGKGVKLISPTVIIQAYLPLPLEDMNEFKRLTYQYAGLDHPLSVFFRENRSL